MKKILSVLAIVSFAFAFSQQTRIVIKADKNQIEKVYPNGLDEFKQNLAGNLQYTANDYQVLGDFKLDFSVDKNGAISDVKISPEVSDLTFAKEVKRDFLRMKNKFASGQKENISVGLSFSRDYRSFDERINLTANNR
ncbi:MAG: hypothetical protein P0Y62_12565 [Candidatus Chryseobacterium colombiense]|nr:hypothetical protein [Chryseobacterium sp.]WEK68683.1 MAG: hypothetical protein P0Y62_12565 [Chryseobacterium sp.]